MKRKRGTHVTLAELARRIYPNLGDDAEKRKGDLSKLENGKVPNPNAATVRKIADALQITDDEIETLQRRALAPLSDQLQEIAVLTRDELELLASRFEAEKPHARSDAELKDFLTKKAEDYRRIRAEIESIPENMLRLSNIKAAAKAAFASGDLDAVEELLSMVQTVEVEEAARTAESRADIALLRNRVDEAFRLLSGAADFFAIIDSAAPGIRRSNYIERLARHGERFGGSGLTFAVRMGRDAVERLDRATAAPRWAAANQNLANACAVLGTRTDGEAGTDLLAEAVAAYRQALTIRTRADHPMQWATTMQNLAIALHTQGTRTASQAGTDLLTQAVATCLDAIEILTPKGHSLLWATTLQSLANALQTQSTRTAGSAVTKLLAQAVAAYRDALTVFTRADHPVQWATTIQNLAIALRNQGSRTAGQAGADLLAQAAVTFHDSLTVFTRADHPVQWATTMQNSAICELSWARHPACLDPLPHLRAALAHVDAALTVYDPVHLRYHHDTATALRAEILAALGPAA